MAEDVANIRVYIQHAYNLDRGIATKKEEQHTFATLGPDFVMVRGGPHKTPNRNGKRGDDQTHLSLRFGRAYYRDRTYSHGYSIHLALDENTGVLVHKEVLWENPCSDLATVLPIWKSRTEWPEGVGPNFGPYFDKEPPTEQRPAQQQQQQMQQQQRQLQQAVPPRNPWTLPPQQPQQQQVPPRDPWTSQHHTAPNPLHAGSRPTPAQSAGYNPLGSGHGHPPPQNEGYPDLSAAAIPQTRRERNQTRQPSTPSRQVQQDSGGQSGAWGQPQGGLSQRGGNVGHPQGRGGRRGGGR